MLYTADGFLLQSTVIARYVARKLGMRIRFLMLIGLTKTLESRYASITNYKTEIRRRFHCILFLLVGSSCFLITSLSQRFLGWSIERVALLLGFFY